MMEKKYELAAYKNIDLHMDGDFQVREVEPIRDREDEPFNRACLYGMWAPYGETEWKPASLTIDLEHEVEEPEDIFGWIGWDILELVED